MHTINNTQHKKKQIETATVTINFVQDATLSPGGLQDAPLYILRSMK